MKHVVLCLLCAAGFAGCASAPFTAFDADVDHQKVAAIERAAQSGGVKVIWVNMPQKAARATGG